MFLSFKKIYVILAVLAFTIPVVSGSKEPINTNNEVHKNVIVPKGIEFVYDSLHLESKGLSRVAYNYAVSGYKELKQKRMIHNDSILTIVDFDQPSYNKRMYIIDIKNFKVLFNTWTAHGKNTGLEMAKYFSNSPQSNKSSLGLYITDKTYNGKNGYSLKLIGLENVNSNASKRAIVLHGAPYVNQRAININGYIGRSHGCPAVPQELNKPIIERIKGGSCFFIYSTSYHHNYSI